MVAYWVAQLAGAVAAACLLMFVFAQLPGQAAAEILAKGTPDLLKEGITPLQGIIIEAVLTFFLMFVIYGSAIDARAVKIAPVAIGFTITLDILFNGPLTGAAMNPARHLGPALLGGGMDSSLPEARSASQSSGNGVSDGPSRPSARPRTSR